LFGKRLRRPALALLLVAAAAIATALVAGKIAPSATSAAKGDQEKQAPALASHLAKLHLKTPGFSPPGSSNYIEGEKTAADEEFAARAYPGSDIPAAALQQSNTDWKRYNGRGDEGAGRWAPLGPTNAKGLPNPYRDRAVYTAGTPNFSGRIAHEAIDPNCGSRSGNGDNNHGNNNGNDNNRSKNNDDEASCRLWITNANGGVWRTDNALAKNPEWKYLSRVFEHNNTASIQLDPNDRNSNTLWVGTGEPNACGSGCEAGVGLYKSTNGGDSWSGPYGKDAFYDRAVGSIAIQPGNSNVMYAASGRGIRGLTSACCGGADALVPGAPHFGVYRSLDGGQHWELVNQGANVLCSLTATPDQVSLNLTACSARGARRVMVDPVDPHTVYASFFARGIWRSKADGAVGTWEQIMARIGPASQTTERAEFDVIKDPVTAETRMYVGVGGGGAYARFRKNMAVRNAPAAAVAASWIDTTSPIADTPQYSSFGYCDTQCSYDNYVFIPAAHFPNSGATVDTVYLSGSERYSENNWGPLSPYVARQTGSDLPTFGRSNGRAVILSTDGGLNWTDMTDDKSDPVYPVELHPDHHALTVNPTNYKQFFDVGDGGVMRSNGNFVDQSEYCVQPKGYTGPQLAFCQRVLSRTPEKLQAINPGLRTLHFYELNYSPFDPNLIVAGAQDNGSWEIGDTQGSGTNGPTPPPNSIGEPSTNCRSDANRGDDGDDGNDNHNSSQKQTWVQINIADGGHNNFDVGDRCFRQSAWQQGQLMVAYTPKNQLDMNWIADSLFIFYGDEAVAMFIGTTINDPVHPHWLFTGREHAFRSTNQGRNKAMTKAEHREFCNVWYGTFGDFNGNGDYDEGDLCDDWEPLGDPGPAGRLTGPAYGADKIKPGGADYVSDIQRSKKDSGTLWAATAGGRVFVSKNADAPLAGSVVFDRIDNDPTAGPTPGRFVSAISIDPKDPNHAIVVFSGFNAKTPGTPGHVFDVHYVPGASTWRLLDGDQPRDALGDIPATSVAITAKGTIYVGTDYGVIASKGDGNWRQAGSGLPNMVAADLMYVPEKKKLYVASHGQGAWELKVDSIEDRGDNNNH
jgi:hypothetical protein